MPRPPAPTRRPVAASKNNSPSGSKWTRPSEPLRELRLSTPLVDRVADAEREETLASHGEHVVDRKHDAGVRIVGQMDVDWPHTKLQRPLGRKRPSRQAVAFGRQGDVAAAEPQPARDRLEIDEVHRRRADELAGEDVDWIEEHAVGHGNLDDAAVVHEHDAVGEATSPRAGRA